MQIISAKNMWRPSESGSGHMHATDTDGMRLVQVSALSSAGIQLVFNQKGNAPQPKCRLIAKTV